MKSIEQTKELFAAALAVSLRIRDSLADGEMGTMDKLKLALEFGPVMKAVEGIEDVPDELYDLDSEEMDQLIAELTGILGAWGVPHRTQDITAALARKLPFLIQQLKMLADEAREFFEILNAMPPVAVLAEDSPTDEKVVVSEKKDVGEGGAA